MRPLLMLALAACAGDTISLGRVPEQPQASVARDDTPAPFVCPRTLVELGLSDFIFDGHGTWRLPDTESSDPRAWLRPPDTGTAVLSARIDAVAFRGLGVQLVLFALRDTRSPPADARIILTVLDAEGAVLASAREAIAVKPPQAPPLLARHTVVVEVPAGAETIEARIETDDTTGVWVDGASRVRVSPYSDEREEALAARWRLDARDEIFAATTRPLEPCAPVHALIVKPAFQHLDASRFASAGSAVVHVSYRTDSTAGRVRALYTSVTGYGRYTDFLPLRVVSEFRRIDIPITTGPLIDSIVIHFATDDSDAPIELEAVWID